MATTYKVLGQSAPSATTDTSVYTVPASTQTVVSTISVCNRGSSIGSVRIFIRPDNETLNNKHYLVFDAPVNAKDTIFLTVGATIDASDQIYVRATTADFSFNIFGSEIS
jgi:hypothetical protein